MPKMENDRTAVSGINADEDAKLLRSTGLSGLDRMLQWLRVFFDGVIGG